MLGHGEALGSYALALELISRGPLGFPFWPSINQLASFADPAPSAPLLHPPAPLPQIKLT